jgi:uncharacterized surface protein with fasciclin (FAS1) repeats
MRTARPTLAFAFPVLTLALIGSLLTTAFSSQAQSTPQTYISSVDDGPGTTPTAPLAPSYENTTVTLATTATFSSFYDLVERAGLRARLQRYPGTFTVFAPTNDALATATPVREQIRKVGAPVIKSVVRAHIVPGVFTAAQLTDGRELETLDGHKLRVTRQADGTVLLDGKYRLRDTGRQTTNGVIYALDAVMVP